MPGSCGSLLFSMFSFCLLVFNVYLFDCTCQISKIYLTGLSFDMRDLITQPGSKLVHTLLRECGVLAIGPPGSP